METTPIEQVLNQLQQTVHSLNELVEKLQKNKQYMEPYLTSKQVKELLQITDNTLQRMREQKLIECYQIGDFSFRYPSAQFMLLKHAT